MGVPPIAPPLRSPTWLHRYHHAFIASHWYGYEVGIDGFLANKLKGTLAKGAGVATLAKYFGGGTAATVIAAALAVFAAKLQLCQKSNGWIYSYLVAGSIVCNPFAS